MQAARGWGVLGHLLVSLPPVIYFFFNIRLCLKAAALGLTCSGETLGFPTSALPARRYPCRCVPHRHDFHLLLLCRSCRVFAGKAHDLCRAW